MGSESSVTVSLIASSKSDFVSPSTLDESIASYTLLYQSHFKLEAYKYLEAQPDTSHADEDQSKEDLK